MERMVVVTRADQGAAPLSEPVVRAACLNPMHSARLGGFGVDWVDRMTWMDWMIGWMVSLSEPVARGISEPVARGRTVATGGELCPWSRRMSSQAAALGKLGPTAER